MAYWPAFLLTGLPACLPAYPPPDQPSGLPACLPSWLSSRCHVFPPLLILPACLPDHLFLLFNDSFISFSLPTCRHADGRGHTFSHLLDLPACLPAGSPFSTSNISFSLPSCRMPHPCLFSFPKSRALFAGCLMTQFDCLSSPDPACLPAGPTLFNFL